MASNPSEPAPSGRTSGQAAPAAGSWSAAASAAAPAGGAATAAAPASPPPIAQPVAQAAPARPVQQTRRGSVVAAPRSPKNLSGPRQRFEARKVRRLIRHVDPWSVLKLSLLFFVCVWLIFMIAGLIVWQVAVSSGSIGKIENFVNTNLGLPDWKLNGSFIFRQYGLIGLILTFAFTGASVLASVVFNLISDIIGGVWVTVIEEETTRPADD